MINAIIEDTRLRKATFDERRRGKHLTWVWSKVINNIEQGSECLQCYHIDIMMISWFVRFYETSGILDFFLLLTFHEFPRFSLGTTSKTMIGLHVPCKAWALPRSHRARASNFRANSGVSWWVDTFWKVSKRFDRHNATISLERVWDLNLTSPVCKSKRNRGLFLAAKSSQTGIMVSYLVIIAGPKS